MLKTVALTCTLFLFATGCKKNDETKGADPTAEAKPGEAKPADKPVEAKPVEAKPAAGATFANAAEYEAKANALLDKMTAMLVADGKDCDKLAADISKFIDDNKGDFDAAKTFEKANPDAKKALDQKMEAKMKDFQAKTGPALEACKDSKSLAAAMQKMPD